MVTTTADLQVFPDKVLIGGLAMHRAAYIDGHLLDISESRGIVRVAEGFDWGYKGTAPEQLSAAILWHFLRLSEDKERAGQLLLSLYRAFNIVLIKQLPQMNFEIEVQLKRLLCGLTGVDKEPISVMFLYVHQLLDKGDSIAAFRYAANYREDLVLPDGVENKIAIKQTGDGAYTL